MPDLDSVRRLMRSALQEAAVFDVGDAAALQAQWEKERILLEAELGMARAAWEQERSSLKAEIQSLEKEQRQDQAARRSEAESLEQEKTAWEEEKSIQEAALLQARIAVDQERAQLRLEIEALNAHHLKAQEASRKEMATLLARIEAEQEKVATIERQLEQESARADQIGDVKVKAIEEELAQAEERASREVAALRASLAAEQQKLSTAQQDWRRQREELVQSLDEDFKTKWKVREDWRRQKAELEARIKSLEGAGQERPPAPAGPQPQGAPEPPAPVPPLEPALDPVWSRIVSLIKPRLLNSTSHLRRLAAGKLPEGQRAIVKMAAGDLVQASDHLKVIEQFLEGTTPPPLPGRVDLAAAAALAAWESAFRLRGLSVSRRLEQVKPVSFHAETLRVALYQVIRNAFEALRRGGGLTVRLSIEPAGETVLSFSDTGAGFSPEALANLFVPFFTTKKGHLGLGLPLARRMLQSWGGDVSAGNQKIGAVVTLRFPAAGGAAPALTDPPPKK